MAKREDRLSWGGVGPVLPLSVSGYEREAQLDERKA